MEDLKLLLWLFAFDSFETALFDLQSKEDGFSRLGNCF